MVSAPVVHRALILCLLIGIGFSLFAGAESLDVSLQSACNVNPFLSCGKVDASSYSHIGPIEDWWIGLGGFVVMFLVELQLFRSFDRRFLHLLFLLSLAGLSISAFFAYEELVLLDHLCPVCLGAYLSNLGVFACALTLERLRTSKRADREEGTPSSSEEPSEPSTTPASEDERAADDAEPDTD